MKGILLHGGHGTRLRPLTHTGPKQLLPIANKPMSQYCIESMKEAGVTEIAVIIGGVGSNKVREYYGNGEKFGVKITYVEQDSPRGISHEIGLCSNFIGNDKFLSKIINDIRNPKWNSYRCKLLRTKCCKLDYVDWTPTLEHDYVNDNYAKLLEQYQAVIAADSYTPVQKYWEIPAAWCLTFMEITERNNGQYLGYIDGESTIFINEKNYQEKFEEFINSKSENVFQKKINAKSQQFSMEIIWFSLKIVAFFIFEKNSKMFTFWFDFFFGCP